MGARRRLVAALVRRLQGTVSDEEPGRILATAAPSARRSAWFLWREDRCVGFVGTNVADPHADPFARGTSLVARGDLRPAHRVDVVRCYLTDGTGAGMGERFRPVDSEGSRARLLAAPRGDRSCDANIVRALARATSARTNPQGLSQDFSLASCPRTFSSPHHCRHEKVLGREIYEKWLFVESCG